MELDVMLTNRCNASCEMCFTEAVSKGKTIDFKTLKAFILKIKKEQPKLEVHLSGGEVTLLKEFYDLLEYINSLEVGFQFVTNAFKLDLSYAYNDLKYLKKVVFSLYGKEAYHDQFVGIPGAYKKIKSSIHYMMDQGVPVQVNITCFDGNLEEIPMLLEDLQSYKIEWIKLYPVVRKGRAESNLMEVNLEDYSSMIYELSPTYNNLMVYKDKKSETCMNVNGFFINELGDIYDCLLLNHPSRRLGNIKNLSLDFQEKSMKVSCSSIYSQTFDECRKILERRTNG